MSVFAPEMSEDEVRRQPAEGSVESDTFANRPDPGGASLIEEEGAGGSDRSYSDAGAERSEDGGGEPERIPEQALGQPPAPAAPAAPQAAGPGFLSRAWGGFKRGMSSLGRGISNAFGFNKLFGRARPAPNPNDLGAVAAHRAQREYQGSAGRVIAEQPSELLFGPRRPMMERLFGAARGGRTAGNEYVTQARVTGMRQMLRHRPAAPGALARAGQAPFLAPTNARVTYGSGNEEHPVGYTPNSSWAVKPHAAAPTEQLGTKRGTSKSGSMPSDALAGLVKAREAAAESGQYTAPGLIRGADEPNLRASVQERKVKARRVASDLARVNPQAGAAYRMNRTMQKTQAALGANMEIPEALSEDEVDEE